MSDSADDLLLYGISAAKANSRDEARNYLEWVLRTEDADYDQQADAWYWLSTITDETVEKRSCLENVLAIAPAYPEARRDLAILDGRLKPADIIDPLHETQPTTPDANLAASDLQLFRCPRCGAHMAADKMTGMLSCGFCGYRPSMSPTDTHSMQGVQEQDWVSAIYAAKGHRWEIPTARTFKCESCGANVMVPAGHVSTNCPFCGTPHVVQTSDERELIEPAGLLPFTFGAQGALAAITAWLKSQHFAPEQLSTLAIQTLPQPIYLPFWTFDLEGSVRWSGNEVALEFGRAKVISRSGSEPRLLNDTMVPGSKSVPADALDKLHFDLSKLVPYSAGQLASWPAEIYSISPSNASMDARDKALDEVRSNRFIRENVSSLIEDVTIEGTEMSVISYKLVLLPVWIGSYTFEGQSYQVVVDGHGAEVSGAIPRNILQKVLNHLLGGF